MSNAFAPVVRARPCPIFGRPVRLRGAPIDCSPTLLLMPFGFQIAPDTLPSGPSTGSRSALAVSGFRLRARLGFSIPPCFPGERGITPLSDTALLIRAPRGFHPPDSRAAQHTLRTSPPPIAPGLSLAGVRLIIPDHAMGLPVLRALSLCTCCRHYPGAATGRRLPHLAQPLQPSPNSSGRPAHRPF